MEDDHKAVWAKRIGYIMWGRLDALDDGWSHKGRIHQFRLVWLTCTKAKFGIGVVKGKRMYVLYWNNINE